MAQIQNKYWLGRLVTEEKTFEFLKDSGSHNALYRAQAHLKLQGFSYGSPDEDNPIAFVKGEYGLPEKWHNLMGFDKQRIDGVILTFGFRNQQSVKLVFFKPAYRQGVCIGQTKEQMLEQYRDDSAFPEISSVVFLKKDALAAMDQYASDQNRKLLEFLARRFIQVYVTPEIWMDQVTGKPATMDMILEAFQQETPQIPKK